MNATNFPKKTFLFSEKEIEGYKNSEKFDIFRKIFYKSNSIYKMGRPRTSPFQLQISNLPEIMNKEKLQEYFSSYGEIVFLEIQYTQTGQKQALVALSSKEQMEKTIQELNGKKIGDTIINVSEYEPHIPAPQKQSSDYSDDYSDSSEDTTMKSIKAASGTKNNKTNHLHNDQSSDSESDQYSYSESDQYSYSESDQSSYSEFESDQNELSQFPQGAGYFNPIFSIQNSTSGQNPLDVLVGPSGDISFSIQLQECDVDQPKLYQKGNKLKIQIPYRKSNYFESQNDGQNSKNEEIIETLRKQIKRQKARKKQKKKLEKKQKEKLEN